MCPSDPETAQPEMSLRTAGNWELKEIVDSRGSACPVTPGLSLVLGSEHRLHPCREMCVWTHTEPPALCLSHGNTRLCPRWSQNSEEGKLDLIPHPFHPLPWSLGILVSPQTLVTLCPPARHFFAGHLLLLRLSLHRHSWKTLVYKRECGRQLVCKRRKERTVSSVLLMRRRYTNW